MKKSIFFLIIITAIANIKIFSQQIIELTPLKASQTVHEMSFVNDTVYFAVTDDGRVFKTTNAGKSWSRKDLFLSGTNVYSICFTDENNGYVTGNVVNRVWRTTDGGDTWSFVNLGTTSVLYEQIFFVNDSTGFIAGSKGTILKTVDYGTTWVPTPTGVYGNILDLIFTNDSTGFAACDSGRILKTTNAGLSWNIISFPSNETLWCIASASDSILYAGGEFGRLLKSIDAGNTWDTLTTILPNTYMRDIAASGPDTVLVCGNLGKILRSYDGGNSFSISTQGVTNFHYAGFGPQHSYIVAGTGSMYYSVDFGTTWKAFINAVPYSGFIDVKFTSPSTAFVMGRDGPVPLNMNNCILKSMDAGKTWGTLQSFPGSAVANTAGDFTDSLHGFISAQPGQFKKTINGGVNWTNAATTINTLVDFQFFDQNKGVGVCNGGTSTLGLFAKTVNAGTSWSYDTITTTSGGPNRMQMLDSLTGYACGGKVFKTTDGGQTWTDLLTIGNTNVSLYFLNDSIGYVSGYTLGSGTVWKTSDGGQSWTMHSMGNNDIVDMIFITPDSGYLVSLNFDIFKTTDGMNSFTQIATGPYYAKTYRATMSQDVIFGVGEAGDIFKYYLGCFSNPGIASIIFNASTQQLISSGAYSYKWFYGTDSINFVPILFSDNDTLNISAGGYYYVQVTYLNGCTSQSSILNVLITGQHEININSSHSIFPNPSSGKFTINFADKYFEKYIQIYDVTGLLLKYHQTNLSEFEIDLSGCSKGVYFVKILTDKNISLSKIVLQ